MRQGGQVQRPRYPHNKAPPKSATSPLPQPLPTRGRLQIAAPSAPRLMPSAAVERPQFGGERAPSEAPPLWGGVREVFLRAVAPSAPPSYQRLLRGAQFRRRRAPAGPSPWEGWERSLGTGCRRDFSTKTITHPPHVPPFPRNNLPMSIPKTHPFPFDPTYGMTLNTLRAK